MAKTKTRILELDISKIKTGSSKRKDPGDIKSLAVNIDEQGLFHSIGVDPNNNLIFGSRRLAAARRLGWKTIPAQVMDLDDTQKLIAQLQENKLRKDFTPSEMVEITDQIADKVRIDALYRQKLGKSADGQAGGRSRRKKNLVVNNYKVMSQQQGEKTIQQLAQVVGTSGSTLYKIRTVVHASYDNPKRYSDLVAEMDRTGNVDGRVEESLEIK